jgi:hypothetical protein
VVEDDWVGTAGGPDRLFETGEGLVELPALVEDPPEAVEERLVVRLGGNGDAD